MSYKNWRNQEVNDRLMKSWGLKAPKNEILNENKEISHLCAMLVTEKATGRVGHPVNHTLLESGNVTHYDVEFDDVIVEGMPVGALEVEIQEEHHHSARREDYPHDEDKPRTKYAGDVNEEEELEEGVPSVKASELDDDDVKDGPGDMSVKDGKLVNATNEATIRKTIREAITKALKNREA